MFKSFCYAARGVKDALEQRNMRVHCAFTFYVITAGFVVRLPGTQWALVLLCCALVLGAEAFNSAIEALCDTLHPGRSEGIRRVKDISAAAVLICAVFSAAVGLIVFLSEDRPARAAEFFASSWFAYPGLGLSVILWGIYIFRR